jgi:hypothetical protein
VYADRSSFDLATCGGKESSIVEAEVDTAANVPIIPNAHAGRCACVRRTRCSTRFNRAHKLCRSSLTAAASNEGCAGHAKQFCRNGTSQSRDKPTAMPKIEKDPYDMRIADDRLSMCSANILRIMSITLVNTSAEHTVAERKAHLQAVFCTNKRNVEVTADSACGRVASFKTTISKVLASVHTAIGTTLHPRAWFVR